MNTPVFPVELKQQLSSVSHWIFGSSTIAIDPQTSKFIGAVTKFDNETYGYVCIEDIECEACSGAACSGFRDSFENKWIHEEPDFFDPSSMYMYESEIVYECGPARAFDDGAGGTWKDLTVKCGWDGNWTPLSTLPTCNCNA